MAGHQRRAPNGETLEDATMIISGGPFSGPLVTTSFVSGLRYCACCTSERAATNAATATCISSGPWAAET